MTNPDASPSPINLPEEKKVEALIKSIEHFVRFGALANAGGIVATMSALAALAKEHSVNALALPLAFFSLGVLSALLVAGWATLTAAYSLRGRYPPLDFGLQYAVRFLAKFEDLLMALMVLCFVAGCVSGIALIAIS